MSQSPNSIITVWCVEESKVYSQFIEIKKTYSLFEMEYYGGDGPCLWSNFKAFFAFSH